jgi:hypothetical protein
LVGVIGDLSDLLGDCPRCAETFLAGEARGEGDGETRGEAEDLGEWGLLAVVGIREFGLFTDGELLQSPRPPGDFERFLGEPGTESEFGVCDGVEGWRDPPRGEP